MITLLKKFTEAIVAVAVAKCVVIVAWIVVRLVTWKKKVCCLLAEISELKIKLN